MHLLLAAGLLLAHAGSDDGASFVQDVAWSPDGRLIACSAASGGWDHGGEYDVFVMKSDGTGTAALTRTAGPDVWVSWSPDGRRLVFGSHEGISVMNADGTGVVRLAEAGSTPSWSPDGRRILYTAKVGGRSQLFVMNADGSQARRLLESPANDWNPIWSPDGATVLFYGDREETGRDQIYLVGGDGTGLRRLTLDTWNNIFPAWSPDGSKIIFASNRGGASAIYAMKADGSDVRKVAGEGFFARYSPDGRSIAYLAGKWPHSTIWLASADGGEAREIGFAGESVHDLLRRQTEELIDAITAGSPAVWERYLDAEARYVDESGAVLTKKQMVGDIRPPPEGVSGNIQVTQFEAVVHGDVAVTTYVNDENEDYHGHKIHCQYRTTETWKKGPDGWRLLAGQVLALRIDPPAVTLPEPLRAQYVGRYALTPTIAYEIRRNGDGLEGQQTGRPPETLSAEAPDVLFVAGRPRYRYVFLRGADGKITGLAQRREAWDIVWKRDGPAPKP